MPVEQERSYRDHRSSKPDQNIAMGCVLGLERCLSGIAHAKTRRYHPFHTGHCSRMVWFNVFLGRVLDKEGNHGLLKCLEGAGPLGSGEDKELGQKEDSTTQKQNMTLWKAIFILLSAVFASTFIIVHCKYTYMNRREYLMQEDAQLILPLTLASIGAIYYFIDPFDLKSRQRRYRRPPRNFKA